jgi:hypothetical protein
LGLTISVVFAELELKLLSPLYSAVMVWVPTVSDDMLKLALPLLRETVLRMVEPSLKLTVPVGVPAPGALAVTLAVKDTTSPKFDVLGAALTAVLVPSWLTVSVAVPELVAKLLSPL